MNRYERRHTLLLLGCAVALGACRSEKAGAPPPRPLGLAQVGMVAIPGGSFQQGGMMSQNTSVDVAPSFLDETEVTVAAYASCVSAGRCTAPAPNARKANVFRRTPSGNGPRGAAAAAAREA